PDATRMAWATDGSTSSLRPPALGDYRLALIDPDSGEVQGLRAFTAGKNINPQWTPDGRALIFISDRDGIPNLYSIGVDSGDVHQLTRIGTGISGITGSSPALSMAAHSRTG